MVIGEEEKTQGNGPPASQDEKFVVCELKNHSKMANAMAEL